MGRIVLFFIVSIFFNCQPLQAATDTTLQLQLTQSLKGSYTDFAVDNLGNIFLVTQANQIKKLNSYLDSIAIFNDSKLYGDIFSIDVSNPLRVLVYYKDYTTILMLDKQLNNRNTIDLRQQNIFQARAIAQSYDNNIWVFDEIDNKLKKIDESGNVLLETPDFRLLFDGGYTPKNIIDINGLLYLYQPKAGWKIFDYYGGFKIDYPILNWQDVQVTDAFLQGHDSTMFYASKPKTLQFSSAKTNINISRAKKIVQKQNICYLLTKDGLEIYKVL
ncbi:hypothetical protein [Parasediminibacterium sp. JCM 36343]|uniref:hypothetical protein n=1 Tax=Parasediminibacterium sp. JCM 36343 TaxID=3374279 RepID=UPI00397B09EF